MNRSIPTPVRRTPVPDFFSPQVSEAERFYLDLNPSKSEPLVVVSGGCEHCTADYSVQRESFPFVSIEYVATGAGKLKIKNKEHELLPGRVFSYGPGVRHEIAGDRSKPLTKYFVDFAGDKSLPMLKLCELGCGGVAQIFPPDDLQDIFDELISAGQLGSRRGLELCVKLLECLMLKIAVARAPLEDQGALSFRTFQQCRQFIRDNFWRLKTLQQIAQECHVDGAYLCRLFQRYDHQTPYQLLMRLKMNQAAGWLQEPDALVKQIAERAGFGDQFHFSRAFKRIFGVAPDEFRRRR